jgi:hypothetical protein
VKYPENPRACADVADTNCHSLCVRYAATLLPAVAERGIDCLREASKKENGGSDACLRACTRTTCTAKAFSRLEGSGDPRCHGSVRGKANEGGADPALAASNAAEFAKQCGRYMRGMNRVGRDRFIECVVANMSAGMRYCLWDVSATPCSGWVRDRQDRDDGDPELVTE